jgi:hypothetical protein
MKAARGPKSTRKPRIEKPRLEVVTPPQPALPAGLHGVIVELRTREGFRVRSMAGERFVAVVGDGVEVELLEECMRTGRMAIACQTVRGPTLVGGLQTTRSLVREADGSVWLDAQEIKLRGKKKLHLQAGTVTLVLDDSGRLQTAGERMVIDMSSNVKVLSALVELP